MKNKMTPVEAVNVIEKKLFDNRAKPYTEEDAQIEIDLGESDNKTEE